MTVDSSASRQDVAADENVSPPEGKGAGGKIIPLILIVGVLVAGGYAWLRHQGELAAAEAEAKSRLQELGGIVVSDESGKHVGSVNLSLVRDEQKFARAMELVADLPWLQVLDLSGRPVTTEQLTKLTHLSALRSLQLSNTDIGDDSAAAIAKLQSLKALHLKGTKLTSASLKQIGSLGDLNNLNLSDTKLDGDLAPLSQLNNLAWLVIQNVPLNDAAIDTLMRLPALSRLTLEEGQITDEQYQRLRGKKGGIKVDGADPVEEQPR